MKNVILTGALMATATLSGCMTSPEGEAEKRDAVNREVIADPAQRRGVHLAIISSETMVLLTYYPGEISQRQAVAALSGYCAEGGRRPTLRQELSLVEVTNAAGQTVPARSITVECR